ncbi:hypothetical protein BpHYR1_026166 [Brachionus plicatilis]|uniref:Uncharacterized protein n=1 Tax=Brachionus plicatilis TaxID=10195 RepID=A0A3M7T7Q4_BRAPC|nr:hypothetical protein BpHYR1_026166 [Brachionus plicatilis]
MINKINSLCLSIRSQKIKESSVIKDFFFPKICINVYSACSYLMSVSYYLGKNNSLKLVPVTGGPNGQHFPSIYLKENK